MVASDAIETLYGLVRTGMKRLVIGCVVGLALCACQDAESPTRSENRLISEGEGRIDPSWALPVNANGSDGSCADENGNMGPCPPRPPIVPNACDLLAYLQNEDGEIEGNIGVFHIEQEDEYSPENFVQGDCERGLGTRHYELRVSVYANVYGPPIAARETLYYYETVQSPAPGSFIHQGTFIAAFNENAYGEKIIRYSWPIVDTDDDQARVPFSYETAVDFNAIIARLDELDLQENCRTTTEVHNDLVGFYATSNALHCPDM